MTEHIMADIHTHIIHNADDGSFSLDMSKLMLAMSYGQGVRYAIATPHSYAFLKNGERVRKNYCELTSSMSGTPFEGKILLGCEVLCEKSNFGDTLENIVDGTFPAMNNTKFVLTEFNTFVTPEDAAEMLTQITECGFTPIIAHVERYPYLFGSEDTVTEIIRLGCRLQVNAFSFDDEPDNDRRDTARMLLDRKLISFIGSDSHSLIFRPPSVKAGINYIYNNCDEQYAEDILYGNAAELIL